MLTKLQIKKLFQSLNAELKSQNAKGEVLLCGGAVMYLVFQTRESTKDIDAIFAPTEILRTAIAKIARAENLPPDWLSDAAKGFFLSEPPRVPVLQLSNLSVYAPSAEYMLAMKCISARFDSLDRDDVIFLIKHLELKTPQEVFAITKRFYPNQSVPAKTEFFVEEVMGDLKS